MSLVKHTKQNGNKGYQKKKIKKGNKLNVKTISKSKT